MTKGVDWVSHDHLSTFT